MATDTCSLRRLCGRGAQARARGAQRTPRRVRVAAPGGGSSWRRRAPPAPRRTPARTRESTSRRSSISCRGASPTSRGAAPRPRGALPVRDRHTAHARFGVWVGGDAHTWSVSSAAGASSRARPPRPSRARSHTMPVRAEPGRHRLVDGGPLDGGRRAEIRTPRARRAQAPSPDVADRAQRAAGTDGSTPRTGARASRGPLGERRRARRSDSRRRRRRRGCRRSRARRRRRCGRRLRAR